MKLKIKGTNFIVKLLDISLIPMLIMLFGLMILETSASIGIIDPQTEYIKTIKLIAAIGGAIILILGVIHMHIMCHLIDFKDCIIKEEEEK